MNLFQITQEYQLIEQQLLESGGELTPELETQLQINSEEMQVKGENYAYICKKLDAENKMIDEEIKRLQAIKKSESKWIDKLKEKLVDAVQIFGDIDLGLKTITTRPSQSVECDLDTLSKEFKITKLTIQADKTKIKNALKDGQKVKGATLIDNLNFRLK